MVLGVGKGRQILCAAAAPNRSVGINFFMDGRFRLPVDLHSRGRESESPLIYVLLASEDWGKSSI